MTVSDYQDNAFGIQWQRCWQDAPYPAQAKRVPHIASTSSAISTSSMVKPAARRPGPLRIPASIAPLSFPA